MHGRMHKGKDEHWGRKHNRRGSEKQNEHDSSGIALNCISVWHFAPLGKKG